ncbi:MAG: phycobiliprotein lyase [Xenococcaceae cyanobacterium MO_207.B15]|nr:phycobiliprotein lyase [Xenococcaceae cyanobacterium MO_207.B15]
MNDFIFEQFFADCVGNWVSERTYHYLTYQEVERSHTEFQVQPLTKEQKQKVLTDNAYNSLEPLEKILGFNLGFYTISDKGEEVRQNLNLMFVPKTERNGFLEGDYLRDRAYEEARPMISHFRFNCYSKELLMTTNYTRVISIDSITLTKPDLRIRKILNYQRPPQGEPLETILLVGFGVEQKQ